jgi:endonuclease YncB( thermonuclease family)
VLHRNDDDRPLATLAAEGDAHLAHAKTPRRWRRALYLFHIRARIADGKTLESSYNPIAILSIEAPEVALRRARDDDPPRVIQARA